MLENEKVVNEINEEITDVNTSCDQTGEAVTEAPLFEAEKTKKIVVEEITCPHCQQLIKIEREVTVGGAKGRKGALAGLTLEQMTDDQLKTEIINANSVLYKAQKRGADADTIAKNQIRVDAAKAEKAKREALKAASTVVTTPAETVPTDVQAETTGENSEF